MLIKQIPQDLFNFPWHHNLILIFNGVTSVHEDYQLSIDRRINLLVCHLNMSLQISKVGNVSIDNTINLR